MALNAHLDMKAAGIKGESKEQGFEDQIQLQSWSWGVHNPNATTHGSGLGSGPGEPGTFNFTMYMNTASPELLVHCSTGQHITSDVILTVCKTGDKNTLQKFLKITYKNVMVASYSTGGQGANDLPLENISLAYESMKMEYLKQAEGGKTSPAGQGGYDFKTKKKVG